MRVGSEAVQAVHDAVRAMQPGRWVLAVSGGRDSMVLLDACAAVRDDIVAVATFDHGTGPAATRATAHVEAFVGARRAQVRVPVIVARGTGARTEAAWRAERWAFLSAQAAAHGARVVTAHTRDDQVETVFLRALRDAGARGLAGMRAPSPVARPFLALRRATVAGYAADRGISWVEDPSNAHVAHLRNRIRHELLPACERMHPGFSDWLWELSGRAEAVRVSVARAVDDLVGAPCPGAASVVVPAKRLSDFPRQSLSLLWPEIVARAGAALDRRGIARLADATTTLQPGGVVPLSNGVTVTRTVSTFVVRNPSGALPLY